MDHVTQNYSRHVENKLGIIRCLGYTEYGAMCSIENGLYYRLQANVTYYEIFSIILRIIFAYRHGPLPCIQKERDVYETRSIPNHKLRISLSLDPNQQVPPHPFI